MDIVIHEQFRAPMATTFDQVLTDHGWLPGDLSDTLAEADMVDVDGPCGRVSVWRAAAWHKSRETRFYYVSAVDGARSYLVAGPYPTLAEAEDRVSQVRAMAEDANGRAHFMAWGTASSEAPVETPMGAL